MSKLPVHVIKPFTRKLFDTLFVCLNSDNWPIRDSACVPIGRLLQYIVDIKGVDDFMEGTEDSSSIMIKPVEIDEVLNLLTLHLQDSIYSIREHAAEAMACLLQSSCAYIAQTAYQRTYDHLNRHLLRAFEQADKEKSKIQFIPPLIFEKMSIGTSTTSSSMSSVASAGNKSFKQTASKWGCGLDCAVGLDCNAERVSGVCDWEASEGCIYLIKELLQIHPQDFHKISEDFCKLSDISNFKDYHRLRTTFYAQLPEIFLAIGKADTKKCLSEELIRRIVSDITSAGSVNDRESASSLMAEEAISCFQKICDQVGHSVVYSRIFDDRTKDLVKARVSRTPT